MVLNVTNIYPDYNRVAEKPMHRPVFGNNQSGLSPAIRDDLGSVTGGFKSVRDKLDRFERGSRDGQSARAMDCAQGALFAGGIIPTIRRVNCIPKDLEEGNWERSALMAGVAALSLPGDWREVKGGIGQLGNIFKRNNGNTSFNTLRQIYQNQFQHPLSAVRGTFVEKFIDINKHKWLNRLDKTLFDTKFGKFIMKTFGVEEDKKRVAFKVIGNRKVKGYAFKGDFFKKLIGNALLRTNVIGLAISTAVEIPAIIKAAMVEGSFEDKAHSVTKQVCKSAGMIALVTGGISLFGAAATLIFPPAGTAIALAGMAIGSAAGVMASKELNKQIDNIFG